MKTITEIEALQNAANSINLVIHEQHKDDKRKTVKMYFASLNDKCVSPVLDYDDMNHFLLGWIKCKSLVVELF